MNVLETEWWTMAIPPEWWADSEEESVVVGDQDGVGCIEISTLHKEAGEFDKELVLNIAQTEAEQPLDWQAVKLGDFAGVSGSYEEEDMAVREWYVSNGSLLLFVTYSCNLENRGMDNAAVDALLDTLMVLDSGA